MEEQQIQRRLAAILAADVVGYSRLIEADEEGTRARLRALHAELINPQIAADGGRIVKTTGDGILVEFSSAVNAVRNAITIQSALNKRNQNLPENQRIQFRVGINVGDVIVEGDDIHGDGVNVAARLEGLCTPGEVFVSGTAYDQTAGKLPASFENLGEQTVKNIVKPIRVYRTTLSSEKGASEPKKDGPSARPDKQSIAVLPFDNLSGDPEQQYFADGMAEDLITDLSKISSLSVVARNSSFLFKEQKADVRDIARKLGVSFLLEGSVRKMGDKLRINAQLIDAGGDHLWAERYDGNMAEIFEFQDRITAEIVGTLKLRLTPADKGRSELKPTDNFEAYDIYLRGRAEYFRYTPEDNVEAEKHLKQAIEIDPNFAEAYAFMARCLTGRWIQWWPHRDENLERAIEFGERAVALKSDSALGYTMLAFAQSFARKFSEAEVNFERALSLEPENLEVLTSYAGALAFWGDPDKTLRLLENALTIDPFGHPNIEFLIGQCHYLSGRYEEAATTLRLVVERRPGFIPASVHLAATLVAMNQIPSANDVVARTLEIRPQLTLRGIAEIYPYRKNEDSTRFLNALRTAGFPA